VHLWQPQKPVVLHDSHQAVIRHLHQLILSFIKIQLS
jgi:hypothetical protein